MKRPTARTSLLLCFIVVVLMVVLKMYSQRFQVVDLQYEGNTIEVRSKLEWRFIRPLWWPREPYHPTMALSFVSATIEDSSGQVIPADEISGSELVPGDFISEDEPVVFEHVSILKP